MICGWTDAGLAQQGRRAFLRKLQWSALVVLMRQSLLPLLVLVLTASCQVEEEPPRTLVDKDSAAPTEDSSAGREQKADDEEDYDLHVINTDRTELREHFEQMDGVAPWVKDCEEWSVDDSRVGLLFPGASQLFIGRPNADGIGDVEKNYEVSSVGIGGSPFEGAVYVMIQASDMRAEKVCLEKLRGTAIRWRRSGGDPSYPDVDGEVVVRDVQFSRAARMESGGEVAATGAFVATLKVSEGAMSRVLREMSAHLWGIVGSALLMVFTAVGGWLTRRLRKAMGGAWSKPNLLSRKRFWRMGQLDAANARDSVAEEQSGEQETAKLRCPG